MNTNDTNRQKAHAMIDHIFKDLLPSQGMAERSEQIKLSHRMLDTMLNGGIALCDAGTGIGKTYAYLAAAAAANRSDTEALRKPVIISTSSIALQNAVKYEYFYDKWVPVSEVLDMLPLKVPDVDEYLDKNRHVELKDTAFHYFLNVSDYRPVGEQEPYEFARRQVKDMLLNVKQVEFMKQVKDDLYQRAVKRDKIKYYLE